MSGKYALVIGNTEYADPGLAKLSAPGKDADAFAQVLRSTDLCAFDDVQTLLNQPEPVVRDAIDAFFDGRKPDDLLVMYFSGHGVRDEYGSLYLAVRNTNRLRLRATAVKTDFIRESMDQSRSRRQVLILDCCNSGAFAQGTKAATGVSIGTAAAFEGTGYGRVVLTASDATQFAWEGDKVIGETENSLFTHFLVKGLRGEADTDSDGRITIDELYDYAYEQIVNITPKQTPGKWSYKQQGEIILRQSTRLEDIKPVQLPDDLLEEVDDTRPYVREAAVQKLIKILQGKNIGLKRSAQEALEKIAADENTTRRVALEATQALQAFHDGLAAEGISAAAPAGPGAPADVKKPHDAAASVLRRREVTQRLSAKGVRAALAERTSGAPRPRVPWLIIGIGAVVLVALAAGVWLGVRNGMFAAPGISPTSGPAQDTPASPGGSTAEAVPPIVLQAKGPVSTLAFSPNGAVLVAGGSGHTLAKWNVATHQPAGEAQHVATDTVSAVAFSPDGNTLAAGGNDNNIVLWDSGLGRVKGELQSHSDVVTSLAFSPDGTMLVSGSKDQTIIVWNVNERSEVLKLRTGAVECLAFRPDGETLASGADDGTITLWDWNKSRDLPVAGDALHGLGGAVLAVAFSPDGSKLAYSSAGTNAVTLWDVAAKRQIGDPLDKHGAPVTSLAFSPDGKLLASGSEDHTVIVWDVASQAALGAPLEDHTDKVHALAFSPDGRTLASGGDDNTIILYDVATILARGTSSAPIAQKLEAHTDEVHSVAFSPDGKLLASGSKDKSIIVWDTSTGRPIGAPLVDHTDVINTLAFSPDGKLLASGSDDNTIVLWDTATWQPVGPPLTGHDDMVTSVAFSPDGRLLASGSVDSSIRLWDVKTREPSGDPLSLHSAAVQAVAFSPDGKLLASAGDDRTIILWDVQSQQQVGQPMRQDAPINALAFSPDGETLAAGSSDHSIVLWNAQTGKRLGPPLKGHTDGITTLTFSPDGRVLASGSWDNTIILWDVKAQKPIGDPLDGNTNSVIGLAFSPDGSLLASATQDNIVMLWRLGGLLASY